MEYLYKSYTKLVNDQVHYFVKKFMTFPEPNGTIHLLTGYGMHTDFEKACSICGIDNSSCRKQLLYDMEQRNLARKTIVQTTRPQKSGQKQAVQISAMVNRWLAERGTEALN